MLKTAEAGHQIIERLFPYGQRAVADIMSQTDRLGQRFVEIQRMGDGSSDLSHFDTVSHPRSVVIV